MCNMHTSLCNESLTLKVGAIQIRQLIRLYPGSWLETGSIQIPELRMNAKFDCHPPTPININEQLEFLRRHDQHTQRLHFLYNTRSQQSTAASFTSKRPSIFGLSTNAILSSCACLGGSPNYYTLVQGEQFFKSTFRLSEHPSFGRSLFRPDLHVIHSHPVFQHKYNWNTYNHSSVSNEQLKDAEVFYPFDFCAQQKRPSQPNLYNRYENQSDYDVPMDSFSLSRSNSVKHVKTKSSTEKQTHKRASSSSILLMNNRYGSTTSSSTSRSDEFGTPKEYLSLNSSKQKSLNDSNSMTELSVTEQQHQSSASSSSIPTHFKFKREYIDEEESISETSLHSSSTDSLAALEEILQKPKIDNDSRLLPQTVCTRKVTDRRCCIRKL